jgi:hypothetical protein
MTLELVLTSKFLGFLINPIRFLSLCLNLTLAPGITTGDESSSFSCVNCLLGIYTDFVFD